MVNDLGDVLSSLLTTSSASGGVRGSAGLDECGKDEWFLMAAATLGSPTPGELT